MTFEQAIEFIIFCPIAGILGALSMSFFMQLVSHKILHTPVNMIEALGSMVTRSLDKAMLVGIAIHLNSGVFFSFLYTALFMAMHCNGLPNTLFAGVGFGFFHGLLVSYVLMFYVAERHPIARYRHTTFQIGILHLFAHMIYGGVVGLVVGIPSQLTA